MLRNSYLSLFFDQHLYVFVCGFGNREFSVIGEMSPLEDYMSLTYINLEIGPSVKYAFLFLCSHHLLRYKFKNSYHVFVVLLHTRVKMKGPILNFNKSIHSWLFSMQEQDKKEIRN